MFIFLLETGKYLLGRNYMIDADLEILSSHKKEHVDLDFQIDNQVFLFIFQEKLTGAKLMKCLYYWLTDRMSYAEF